METPMTADPGTAAAPVPVTRTVLLIAAVGAAVALALGVYGRVHTPTGIAINVAGFSGPQEVKVWLATLAFVGVLIQLGSALVMYGKIRVGDATWASPVHRWSGRIAFLLTVPVAVHCLYALGFQTYDTRVLVHSIVGCLFYGAFTTKMLALGRDGLSGWTLPVLGGLVFSALVLLWLTSSLWFFTTVGVRF
jgi:hypothetical protein